MVAFVLLALLTSSEGAPPLASIDTADAVAAADGERKKPTAGYDKGFFIGSEDGRFKITMGGYVQGFYGLEVLSDSEYEQTFRVRRARLKWRGHVFVDWLRFQLEYDFADTRLLSTFVELGAIDALQFRAGQFKTPFNVEGMCSASTLQFVDRSLVDGLFGFKDQRQPGIELLGKLWDGALEYAVAAQNGEGLNVINENALFGYAARLVWNFSGHHGYSLSDTKTSETPAIALGVGGSYNDTPEPIAHQFDHAILSGTADLSFKFVGLSGHGAYFMRNLDPDRGRSRLDHGIVAAIGYFVVPEHFEVAARTAHQIGEGELQRGEYTAGANLFIVNGHSAKVQVDYSVLTDAVGRGNRIEHRARALVQIKI